MAEVSAIILRRLDDRRLHFIPAALDSVLAQRCDDREVILVHNGSNPDRKRLINEYVPTVGFLYARAGKRDDARSRGGAAATRDDVAFLDDNDVWDQETFPIQSDALDANSDVDVLFTDRDLFNDADVVHPSCVEPVGELETLDRAPRVDAVYVQRDDSFEYLIRKCPFLLSCRMGQAQVLLRMPFVRTLSEDRKLLWRLSRAHALSHRSHADPQARPCGRHLAPGSRRMYRRIVERAPHAIRWTLSERARAMPRGWQADTFFDLRDRCAGDPPDRFKRSDIKSRASR